MKSKYYFYLLTALLCLNVQQTNAQKVWNQLEKVAYASQKKELYVKKNFPAEYRLFQFNVNLFSEATQAKSSKGVIVNLPNAEGVLSRFLIKESSNFEAGLQAKFPSIKSFTATGIDDPKATAKISLGTDGFHATIYKVGESTVYIDPYTKDHKEYIIYKRSSLSKVEQDFKCEVDAVAKKEFTVSDFARNANDGKLRTYRMALVCSGEYAQFHLGANQQNVPSTATDEEKKTAVLSAMNTSMTRINGVFERDLSVRMVLVNDNDKVIFLDENTDNITDGNAGTMINEVQTICDTEIGTANYDIGHIFSVGGDGLAGLGVVCTDSQKARGVTGIASPVGDPYDIDYVAHEIGHQFGATHTQNNDCNRTNSTAIEPGSGSTIMGYAGICSPNVIGTGSSTGNSDDYFHAISIVQMSVIIEFSGGCAVETNTNNSAPTANAGPDYTIPASTPFKLVGSATDANGLSSLSYNWEQIDAEVGNMPPLASNSEGPMFRSLPSEDTPVRYMPNVSSVLKGTGNTWEVLPSVAREMNFSFLVRDNNPGGGSTAIDDTKITVVNSAAFEITAPNTAVTWNTGDSQTITWQKGATDISPINCQSVNIKLSTDGGLTFPILLKENTPNDGSETIVVPNHPTAEARILIEPVDNIFYNVNATDFTINSSDPTFILSDISGTQTVCNSGNQTATFTIGFDFINGFNENVGLSASGNPLGSDVAFSPNTINADGTVELTISNFDGVAPIEYPIKITGSSLSVTQEINLIFKVNSATFDAITLSAPANNAQNVALNSELQWNADANATSYDVEIASDANFSALVSSGTVTTNAYSLNSLNSNATYFWRVKAKNNCGEGAYSEVFSFTTESCDVCTSSGDTTYATSTTLVNFNTINNASGKPSGYSDYTAIFTAVQVKDSYDLSVNVNTDGNYRVQTKVWIDWNQNCSFDDAGEEYDLGAAGNTSNGATDLSPLSISVPAGAKLGNTTMRVSSRYTDPAPAITYPTACMQGFDGEVEDYTIIVEDATASIADVSFEGFNLYPNPTTGAFRLKFEMDTSTDVQLQLYDVKGMLIDEKTFKNTNLTFSEDILFANISTGLYILKVVNGSKRTARKLVIK